MQSKSDTTIRVTVASSERPRIERELDLFLAFRTCEADGLGAIEDRELVIDAWALLDLAAGKDAPADRVERIVRAMDEWSAAEMAGMAEDDAERERASRDLFTRLLAHLPKPRTQALRQLRPSIVEG